MPARPAQYKVVALRRGLALIESLVGLSEGRTLTELARRIRATKPSTLRLLATLQEARFVERDGLSGHYRLTHRIGILAAQHGDSADFSAGIRPILRRLSEETGELAELGLVVGGKGMVIAAASKGIHRLRVEAAKLGEEIPLHATALGKAWLAQLPEPEAVGICKAQGLKRYTRHTLTSLRAVRQEFRRIRAQGYALSREERYEGTFGVAASIISSAGLQRGCLGAVVVLVPVARITPPRVEELARRVLKAAEELSEPVTLLRG